MKAIILFHGDPSVGLYSYSFEAEIPSFDNENREEVREIIKKLYTELDGEFTPSVWFNDERND